MSWLIAVLVVAGVLAAMTGDRLGHRLGKKRVTMFSLRPRHTGVLATSLAGALIALFFSPLALWSAGFFAAEPDPIYVQVPVARRAPAPATAVSAAAPEVIAVRPSAVAVAKAAPVSPPAPVVAPQVGHLQQQLQVAHREIGTLRKALAAKPAPVRVAHASEPMVARKGELLCSAQIPGGLGPQAAQQALRDVLTIVERYGQRRGAAPGMVVASSQVADMTSRLQSVGAYVLHVQAGRHARRTEPLTVQLSLQALPPGSLAELQERDRVERSASSSQAAVDAALAQVPSGDAVPELPAQAYVPLAEALKSQEHKTRLVWRGETVSGGPLLLRVSPDTADKP